MQIQPLPGNMIVELESRYKNTGAIHVPERYRRAPHLIGTVKRINSRRLDTKTLGHEVQAGQRVIVSHLGGRRLEGNEWIYPITATKRDVRGRKYQDSIILAIVPADVNLAPHAQEIERCQFCGEAKPGSRQNMIMVDGKCPRCGRDATGDTPGSAITVSDAEVEEFVETQQRAAAS